MTDHTPPDDEDFGTGSGTNATAPTTGPASAIDEEAALDDGLVVSELYPVDEPGDDPIAAVTDFMDDLIEVDGPGDGDHHDPDADLIDG